MICKVWGENNLETFIEPKDFPCTGQPNSCPSKVLGSCVHNPWTWRVLGSYPYGSLVAASCDQSCMGNVCGQLFFSFLKQCLTYPMWNVLNRVSSPTDGAAGTDPCTNNPLTLGGAGFSLLSMRAPNVPSIVKWWVLALLNVLAVVCEGGYCVYEGRCSLGMWVSQGHMGRLIALLWPPPLNPTFPMCGLNRTSETSRGFFWGHQALASGQWSFQNLGILPHGLRSGTCPSHGGGRWI